MEAPTCFRSRGKGKDGSEGNKRIILGLGSRV